MSGVVLGPEHWYGAMARRWNRAWGDPSDEAPTTSVRYSGTVHVMGDRATGFQVGHESASGNSWGSFSGPYARGVAAIAAAHTLNRVAYNGDCEVEICQAALDDRDGVGSAPSDRGGF